MSIVDPSRKEAILMPKRLWKSKLIRVALCSGDECDVGSKSAKGVCRRWQRAASGFRIEAAEREVGTKMTGSTAGASSLVEHTGHEDSRAYVEQTPAITLFWILIAR